MNNLPRSSHIDIDGYALPLALAPLWRDAMVAAQNRHWTEALARMDTLLVMQPDFWPACVQKANFLLGAGHYRDAEKVSRALADCAPPSVPFALHAVKLLRRFEHHALIAGLVERCDHEACEDVAALVALAGELGPIGLYAHAQALLERVEKLAPDNPRAKVLGGTLAFIAGRTLSARELIRDALAASNRELPHMRWMLTMQPEATRVEPDIAAMQVSLGRVAAGSEDEAYLRFGLHNLFHAKGDYEASWNALERGCAIMGRRARYDRHRQRRVFDALKQAAPGPALGVPVGSGPRLVFIVGMFRSGTSVVERVLAGHDDVTDGGETYVLQACLRTALDLPGPSLPDEALVGQAAAADLTGMAERFAAHALWRANGRRVLTEKWPLNFFYLDVILRAFPDACVVHLQRDAMDTCFSNLRTFFSDGGGYSYDQADLADFRHMYADLMAYWHVRFPGRILDVDYQAFVDDPDGQARRLLAFCGLDFRPGVLEIEREGGYAATASLGSVRQGILRDRGNAWHPYRDKLGVLAEGLEAPNS